MEITHWRGSAPSSTHRCREHTPCSVRLRFLSAASLIFFRQCHYPPQTA